MMDESRAGRVPGGTKLFFPKNKRNDQERSHRLKKKTYAKNAFLKVLEQFVKEWNGSGIA